MKQVLIAFVVMGFFTTLFAEQPKPADHEKSAAINGEANGFGVGGSVYWTWGFMYRRYFANGLGFSANAGGWFDRSHGHLGAAVNLLYSPFHYRFTSSSLPDSSIRVYLAGSLAPIYDRNASIYRRERETQDSFHFGFGAGPGLEYFFNRHFAIHGEVQWMTFFRTTTTTMEFRDSYPHVGGGFIYYF